ncbi:MAG: FIST C-terminal domain-containing protein [Hyphomicrobiales bacterium]|nr:FIST C-terminal domain-containing protein [Hyphomicrobiales bacterium]
MAQGLVRSYASGVRCALWPDIRTEPALAHAAHAFAGMDIALLLVFAAAETDPQALSGDMARHFPGVAHIACSTAGEIGPNGYSEGSIVALALPADGFCASIDAIEDLSKTQFEDIVRRAEQLRKTHEATHAGKAGGADFALSFVDGLSQREEVFVSALHRAMDGVPLLGGSTGDDLAFKRSWCVSGGRVLEDCGVMALVRTRHPFHVFRHDNFEPTEMRLVVTDCDQDARTVREFNAAPAAREYADCIGVDPATLDPMSFAAHPVVVKVGGEYYCRSIGHTNADGSLTFFCAVETGLVLTVARSNHLVDSARAALTTARGQIRAAASDDGKTEEADLVLGFDCALRRLDAAHRQMQRQLSDVYRENGVIGFNTFGEQFGAMHLNQTFTGLAIGAAPRPRP